ncbi:Dam family site-specific DNA-(adenine-N6)-methyltransferase, partial [Enterococcus faecium]|nr:Dam family site-specific DNA-(adenine-N6)-methyltransferase [Enterococcus faecium]
LKNELKDIEKIYAKNRLEFEFNKLNYPNERVEDPNESFYYLMRDMFNKKVHTNYLFGTLYYFINKTAYSGMIRYNSNGEFNVPYGRYKNFNTDLLTKSHAKLLQTADIYNDSYQSIFEKVNKNDFIFLDPPYDTTFSSYGNEIATGDFGEKEHRLLAQDFKNLDCKAMMIISETVLINELYEGYIIDKYPKKYSVNIRNRFKSNANHLIITNYKTKKE